MLYGCTNTARNQQPNLTDQPIETRINQANPFNPYGRDNITEFDRKTPYNQPDLVDRNAGNENLDVEYNTRRAKIIAQDIANLTDVESATVVITGNTALVGLNLPENVSDEQVDRIKRLAEKKCLATDSALKNASITASPEMVERIRNISRDIGQGRPITGLGDELGSILRRVTPTI
jgi:YhcN/YlaJ family sporulation lipoprotein